MSTAPTRTPTSGERPFEEGPPPRAASPEELTARVEELSERLETITDPYARGLAEELLGAVIELYGEGLERIARTLAEGEPAAAAAWRSLADDGVVASLMLIHGLYPVPLRTRVEEALEGVRPYMHSHGGDVELLGLEEGVARLRLEGSCRGCPASQATLEQAIADALRDAAPDLAGMEVEGAAAEPSAA